MSFGVCKNHDWDARDGDCPKCAQEESEEPLKELLRSASYLLSEINGHACTCSSCVADETNAKILIAKIAEVL